MTTVTRRRSKKEIFFEKRALLLLNQAITRGLCIAKIQKIDYLEETR
jgi:hypothetical protein